MGLDDELDAACLPRGIEAVRATKDDVIGSFILKCMFGITFFEPFQRLHDEALFSVILEQLWHTEALGIDFLS